MASVANTNVYSLSADSQQCCSSLSSWLKGKKSSCWTGIMIWHKCQKCVCWCLCVGNGEWGQLLCTGLVVLNRCSASKTSPRIGSKCSCVNICWTKMFLLSALFRLELCGKLWKIKYHLSDCWIAFIFSASTLIWNKSKASIKKSFGPICFAQPPRPWSREMWRWTKRAHLCWPWNKQVFITQFWLESHSHSH